MARCKLSGKSEMRLMELERHGLLMGLPGTDLWGLVLMPVMAEQAPNGLRPTSTQNSFSKPLFLPNSWWHLRAMHTTCVHSLLWGWVEDGSWQHGSHSGLPRIYQPRPLSRDNGCSGCLSSDSRGLG
jgi:hypothetical protein